jgi:hypothetical protein
MSFWWLPASFLVLYPFGMYIYSKIKKNNISRTNNDGV